MVEQSKIDLAVLLKLFQHAEADGEGQTPSQVRALFDINIPARRIQLALETLEARGEVEREYHPHFADEGLWHVSRGGLLTVEKALKLPNSFICRLAEGGDAWLQGEEAKRAVLGKNARYAAPDSPAAIDGTSGHDAKVSIQVAPVITTTIGEQDTSLQRSSHKAGWLGAWAGVIGTIVAIAALYIAIRG